MESLPSDTLLDILSRVPTECKLVCKKWQTLIHGSGNYFTNMHLSHIINNLCGGDDNTAHWQSVGDEPNKATMVVPSLFFACQRESCEDPGLLYHGGQINTNEKYTYKENLKKINHPPLEGMLHCHLVGSCNGLICTFIRHYLVVDPIYIFNPITREYVYLPELVVEPSANLLSGVACGFGYASSTNEYKVVRIHYPPSIYKGHVEVYTLGSGCGWRAKGTIPFRLSTGVYANGAIYWKGEKDVVAFDLADEEFRFLPFPPCMSKRDHHSDMYGLVALGGRLCFFWAKLRLEIWSLMERGSQDSDAKEIWCLEFDIGFEDVNLKRHQLRWFKPVLLTENGEVILILDTVLYCYDSKTRTVRMISDDEDYFANVEAIPHINTFASLEAMGEKSKRYLADGVWEDNNG